MSNMAYCRFYNTRRDLRDCIEAIECGDIHSAEEKSECVSMIEEVIDYLVNEGIVEVEDGAFEEWSEFVEDM